METWVVQQGVGWAQPTAEVPHTERWRFPAYDLQPGRTQGKRSDSQLDAMFLKYRYCCKKQVVLLSEFYHCCLWGWLVSSTVDSRCPVRCPVVRWWLLPCSCGLSFERCVWWRWCPGTVSSCLWLNTFCSCKCCSEFLVRWQVNIMLGCAPM